MRKVTSSLENMRGVEQVFMDDRSCAILLKMNMELATRIFITVKSCGIF